MIFYSFRLLLLLQMLTLAFSLTLRGEENPVEDFKAFLASPPCVNRLVFIRESNDNIKNDSESYKTNASLYLLRWQTNAFFLCEGKRVEQFNESRLPNTLILSAFDSNRWYASGYAVNHTFFSPTVTNDVSQTTSFGKGMAALAMGLGIHLLVPGTLSWSTSTNFTAECSAEGTLQGQIEKITDGRVSEVSYSSSATPLWRFILRYEYLNPQLPNYLPSTIHKFDVKLDTSHESETENLAILHFETNTTPLSIDAFNPSGVMATNAIFSGPIEVRYTNKTAFQRVGKPWLPIAKATKSPAYLRFLFFAALLVLSLFIAYVAIKTKKQK